MKMPTREPKQRPFVAVFREGDAVPDVALVDERGQPFSFARPNGRITIVSFIYTRCGDAAMCPLVSAKFSRMQQQVRGVPIRLVTLTIDPTSDTPAVLARYGRGFGARPSIWSLVTGSPERVNDLVSRFGIVSGPLRPGTIGHTEAAIVLDARGRVAQIIDGAAWNPSDVLAVANALARHPNDPLGRLRLWLTSSASALCGGRGSLPLSVAGGLAILAVISAAFALAFRRLFRFQT